MLLGLAEAEGARVQSSPGSAKVAQEFRAAFEARDLASEAASTADVRALDVESGKRQPDGRGITPAGCWSGGEWRESVRKIAIPCREAGG